MPRIHCHVSTLLGRLLLLCVLSAIGMVISLPLILIRPYVCDWFYIFFFSVVLAWFSVDNWVLAQDLGKQPGIDWHTNRDHDHILVIQEIHAQSNLLKSVNRSLKKIVHKLERVKGGG
jgi:hypothetical protein